MVKTAIGGKLDVYMIEKEGLMVARFTGTLDARLGTKIVSFIELRETFRPAAFNRFCDMSGLTSVSLSSDDVLQLAARRREFNPNSLPVKSAIFVTEPLAFGMAGIYQKMLNSPRIEVRVFDDRQVAADWLGVNVATLTL